MNIVVAITGASGAIYARQVLDLLINSAEVINVALVLRALRLRSILMMICGRRWQVARHVGTL